MEALKESSFSNLKSLAALATKGTPRTLSSLTTLPLFFACNYYSSVVAV